MEGKRPGIWHTPGISVTWKAEAGGSQIQGSLIKSVRHSQKHKGLGCSSVEVRPWVQPPVLQKKPFMIKSIYHQQSNKMLKAVLEAKGKQTKLGHLSVSTELAPGFSLHQAHGSVSDRPQHILPHTLNLPCYL